MGLKYPARLPEQDMPPATPDENFLYGFKGASLREPPADRAAQRACGLFGPIPPHRPIGCLY
ncbi:hypothetical protein GCM10010439_73450 [Actinocorallia aurantiaca]|uniref:Uncharacterized protein n=1 Tax=Actinocorallia aurantiaca TaxID=46204 RepID=A0ABP6H9J4_9ACTN